MPTLPGDKSKKVTRRSRFVVDVDGMRRADEERREQQRASRRPRFRAPHVSPRGRRRLAIFAGALGLVALGLVVIGYSWYSGYRSSPAYSLALLADAAQKNDRRAVDALLDVDGVTRSLVPQVKAKVAERGAAAVEGGPPPIPVQVRRYVEQNAGVLVPGARDAVREAVVGSITRGVADKVDGYPFFVAAVAASFAADEVRAEGDVASVSFKQDGRPVELVMQRSGDLGHWRVVSVKSDELAGRIADNLARGLPALGR